MWNNDKIKTTLFRTIKESELAQEVNGVVSKKGRPANSNKEDIVISVISNSGCGQTQRVFVSVNVYIQDLYNPQTKAWEENTTREAMVAPLCEFLFHLHGDGMKVKPQECSQDFLRVNAEAENGQTETYIFNRLYIEINNE